MANFWDERYSNKEYVYGTEPNSFFKEELLKLPPRNLLLPAEGEGRNAAFAALSGWKVTAFDSSEIAIKKASILFEEKNVTVNYNLDTFENFSFEENYFDCIGLIFVHIPESSRIPFHKKLINLLKPNGIIILEGFSKKQLNFKSGGPNQIEMLFSEETIISDFGSFNIVALEEKQILLNEGNFHKGKASVIRFVGRKST